MTSIMIIVIFFLLGFTIIGIATWRKVRTPKPVTLVTATIPTPTTPAPATPKKPFNWTWLKWIVIIGVIIFVISMVGSCMKDMVIGTKTGKEIVVEPQPNFQATNKIAACFTPNHIGEWKIGRLLPGEYQYEISGQYLKKWGDGNHSPINSAEGRGGIDQIFQNRIPFPDRGYGMIFLRVGKQYVFPGERFSVTEETDIFAEPNIVRNSVDRNYENSRSVKISIDPAEKYS
jgi:hypothetical protein